MSMTREEAAKWLEETIQDTDTYFSSCSEALQKELDEQKEVFLLALTALRPVSREQVEKVFPGCQMCEGWNTIKLNPCANGDLGVQADIGSSGKGDTFGLVVYNRRLASGYVNFQFCPFCGKPKTDEAVQMVMERLEEMKNG